MQVTALAPLPTGSDRAALLRLWQASLEFGGGGCVAIDHAPSLRARLFDGDEPGLRLLGYRARCEQIVGVAALAGAALLWLYVAPAYRGQGAGSALLRRVINEATTQAESVTVLVNERDTAAQAFFQHFGFEVIGRTPASRRQGPAVLHLLKGGVGSAME